MGPLGRFRRFRFRFRFREKRFRRFRFPVLVWFLMSHSDIYCLVTREKSLSSSHYSAKMRSRVTHINRLGGFQDAFDHDKGQIHLQFRGAVSTGGSPLDFLFFSSVYVQFSKTSPLKSGESSEKSSGENRVKSCHVCSCHGFFGPEACFSWKRGIPNLVVWAHEIQFVCFFPAVTGFSPCSSFSLRFLSCCSKARKDSQSQEIARTAPKKFLNNSRALPSETGTWRQVAPATGKLSRM